MMGIATTAVMDATTTKKEPAIVRKYRECLERCKEAAASFQDVEGEIRSLDAISCINRGSLISVHGVVTANNTTCKSGGTDYKLIVNLTDPTIQGHIGCNLFKPNKEELPEKVSVGDIIILLNVRITEFNGKPQLLSSRSFQSFHYARASPELRPPESSPVGDLVRLLEYWYAESHPPPTLTSATGASESTSSTRYEKTIGELSRPNVFIDLNCQVIYVGGISNCGKNRVLYVTDFTKNTYLRNFGELRNAILPVPCEMIMVVTLWDDNVRLAENLKPGDYVYIRNMRIKTVSDGKLEGALHGSRGGQNMSNISHLEADHPSVLGMKKRCREANIRSSAPTNIYNNVDPPFPFMTIAEVLKRKEAKTLPKRIQMRVKVIDHLPGDVKQFSRKVCTSCIATAKKDGMCPKCGTDDSVQIQYFFSLLGYDGGDDYLPLVLRGPHAEMFMQDIPPTDFVKDEAAFERLKCALGTLWTVGQGIGFQRVSDAMYFDCMVEAFADREHGVEQFQIVQTEVNW
ncbi:3-ketoacyl-CoA thiolase with broad chain length specificity [Chytridiales sp. JEL 0842]|nr:3-ketoacyl-CoA thiolase with broad chain length specificity [Chytridiales sp. JEL 0842]